MEEWPTIGMGNLQAMMVMRQQIAPVPASNGFDPYQTMLRRKQTNVQDDTGYIDTPVQEYDPKDIRALEEFCQKYGIIGFNCGKMSPKAALQMLKKRVGVIDEVVSNKKILLD